MVSKVHGLAAITKRGGLLKEESCLGMRNMVSMTRICLSVSWHALWGVVVARKAVAVVGKGRLEYLSMRPNNIFQSIQSLLQFSTIAGSQARLFALLVFTNGAIASTPTARGLATITFHLE